MHRFFLQADDVLRQRPWRIGSVSARRTLGYLATDVVLFGMLYGAVMGSFGGLAGERMRQVVFAALKVPLLLLATSLLAMPSFFVLNTLLGLRNDFFEATRALLATQAAVAIILASLAPLTILWYATSGDYSQAILFNGLMFAAASFAGQAVLRGYYRPLIRRNSKHRWAFWAWMVLYVFIGIQMGWVLRPFVGSPGAPVQFFRAEAWGNAYEVVARLIWKVLVP